jgi:hypothetical protein
MRENGKHARKVARELIDTKRKNMQNGEKGRDVLSLLSKCFQECWMFADRLSTENFEQSREAGMSTVK